MHYLVSSIFVCCTHCFEKKHDSPARVVRCLVSNILTVRYIYTVETREDLSILPLMCYCAFTLKTWGIIMTLCRFISFRIIDRMYSPGGQITISEAVYETYVHGGIIRSYDRIWLCFVVIFGVTTALTIYFM